MKPIKNSILLLLTIVVLSGCTSLARFINGEKRMKLETPETVFAFAQENNLGIDFDKNLFLKQRKKNEVLAQFRTYNDLENVSFPDVYFFTPDGQFIEDENEVCYNQKTVNETFDYYDDFFNSSNLLISPTKRITDLENELVNHLGEVTFPFNTSKKNSYTAIVLWSKYKGKMWANETNFIIKQLQHSSINFDIYFLNMDEVQF